MKRLVIGTTLCGMLLAVSAVSAPQTGKPDPSKQSSAASNAPLASAVEGIGLTVRDADRSAEFFKTVLDFEPVSDVEVTGDEYDRQTGIFAVRLRIVTLKLGTEVVELTEFLTPRGRPYPSDSRSNDHLFQHVAVVVRDIDEAYKRLRKHKVGHVSPAVQTLPEWNKAAAGIRAFYFKDPDGHPLELIQFPAGKGDPRWQKPTDRLFLGIDHTAVVVADTDAGVKFYRDKLGLTVAGGSENSGPEQERLNAVFGARLRITTLRAEKGPGIELLEYLAPHDGRDPPTDLRANDLAHTRTLLRGNAPAAVEGRSAPALPGSDPDHHPLRWLPR